MAAVAARRALAGCRKNATLNAKFKCQTQKQATFDSLHLAFCIQAAFFSSLWDYRERDRRATRKARAPLIVSSNNSNDTGSPVCKSLNDLPSGHVGTVEKYFAASADAILAVSLSDEQLYDAARGVHPAGGAGGRENLALITGDGRRGRKSLPRRSAALPARLRAAPTAIIAATAVPA